MPAIDLLVSGFKVFKARYYEHRPELYENLRTQGQNPEVMVVACSDSRVDPAILLGAEPGELFVIRNVANLIPPYQPDGKLHGTSAALEFGIRDLKVKHLLVLGHSGCGGIQALRRCCAGDPLSEREFIAPWVSLGMRACEIVPSDPDGSKTEQAAIEISLENIATFPWVADGIKAGTLSVHGWWFDLQKGALWGYDAAKKSFAKLV
ncbi:MAG: carbonic anhydrase [Alphaproteobacteria bacterium]|nr:carbonic anhydrase [Alphaproteobacteria bacterium]